MNMLEATRGAGSFWELVRNAAQGDQGSAYALLRKVRPTIAALTSLRQCEAGRTADDDLEASTAEACRDLWQVLSRPLATSDEDCRARLWKITDESLQRMSRCESLGLREPVDWSRLPKRALQAAAARIGAAPL